MSDLSDKGPPENGSRWESTLSGALATCPKIWSSETVPDVVRTPVEGSVLNRHRSRHGVPKTCVLRGAKCPYDPG